MTRRPLSDSTSTITMHVRLVTGLSGRPNLRARSTTATTLPRRLITPRTKAGVDGTRVTVSCSMISRTRSTAMAYSPPASEKVRYWARSGALAADGIGIMALSPFSESPELALGTAAGAGRAARGRERHHGRRHRDRLGRFGSRLGLGLRGGGRGRGGDGRRGGVGPEERHDAMKALRLAQDRLGLLAHRVGPAPQLPPPRG